LQAFGKLFFSPFWVFRLFRGEADAPATVVSHLAFILSPASRLLDSLILLLPAAPHLTYINNCRRRHFRDTGPSPELYELRTFFDITDLRSAGAAPACPGVMGSRRETAFGGFGSASCVSAPFPAPGSCLSEVTPIGSPDLGLGPSASGPVRVSPTQSHQLEQAWGTGCGRRRQIEE